MGFKVTVSGTADLRTLRDRMVALDKRGLGKPMAKALNKAADPLRKEIRAETVRSLPSGYGPTMARSLRFRQQARGSGTSAEVVIRVYAQGRAQRRFMPDANKGKIRHPRWGDRGHWYQQKVRGGFVDRPQSRLAETAARRMQDVIDDVAKQIGA